MFLALLGNLGGKTNSRSQKNLKRYGIPRFHRVLQSHELRLHERDISQERVQKLRDLNLRFHALREVKQGIPRIDAEKAKELGAWREAYEFLAQHNQTIGQISRMLQKLSNEDLGLLSDILEEEEFFPIWLADERETR